MASEFFLVEAFTNASEWQIAPCIVKSIGMEYRGNCDGSSAYMPSRSAYSYGSCMPPKCADEGETCHCPHPLVVQFGVGDRWIDQPAPEVDVECSVDEFQGRDPAPWQTKMCRCGSPDMISASQCPAVEAELLLGSPHFRRESGVHTVSPVSSATFSDLQAAKDEQPTVRRDSDTDSFQMYSLRNDGDDAPARNSWTAGSSCYDAYLPWALVSVSMQGQEVTRCAYHYGSTDITAEDGFGEADDLLNSAHESLVLREARQCKVRQSAAHTSSGCTVALGNPRRLLTRVRSAARLVLGSCLLLVIGVACMGQACCIARRRSLMLKREAEEADGLRYRRFGRGVPETDDIRWSGYSGFSFFQDDTGQDDD